MTLHYRNYGDSADDGVAQEGKFVHLRNASDEFLVFSPAELDKYHANIVERFCTSRSDIAFEHAPNRDEGVILDPGWEVLGGGRYTLDRAGGSLKLYDSSKAYGPFNPTRVIARLSDVAELADFVITAES